MTLSTLAVPPSRATIREPEYVPGVCNIGPDEIGRRRRSGHLGALFTLALFLVLLALGVPPLVRFVVALPAAGAAAGYLQAWLKFCAAFGWLGVLNFGRRGRTERVDDPAARARDRARALQIGAASAVVGVLVGLIAVLWP
ncbi:MAG: hypothetical protein M3P18_15860 [Actinomycetota bacterium]|nr:hypothetical protein [Actinomycetota bacterium]